MSAILDFLRSVLGNYNPILSPDGWPVSGISGVNFEYLLAGSLLVVCIYSVFRIIGGLICRNF